MIDVTHLFAAKVLHHVCNTVWLTGCHQQMHMVSHQHLSMHHCVVLFSGCLQILPITLIILCGIKTGFTVVTALYDVQGCTNTAGAWMHRSGDTCCATPGKLKRGLRAMCHLLVIFG